MQQFEAHAVEVLVLLVDLATYGPKAVGGIGDGKDLARCVEDEGLRALLRDRQSLTTTGRRGP